LTVKASPSWEAELQKAWQYGKAGDIYPVAMKEVWGIGPHILACGDLEEDDARKLLKFTKILPDVTYSDPPWDKGNARAFRTKAGLGRDVNFDNLLTKVIEAVKDTRSVVWLEMGVKETPKLWQVVNLHNGEILGEWNVTYYSIHPSRLIATSFTGDTFPLPDFGAMDDGETPFAALRSAASHFQRDFTVFDPCIGRGIVAEAALAVEARVLGMELNPRRLAVTVEKLAKATSQAPVLLGELQ
jgi:hypothetical protein